VLVQKGRSRRVIHVRHAPWSHKILCTRE
jgi:hypothetical protein